VPPFSAVATGIVFVKDLNLRTIRLEPRQNVHARVVAHVVDWTSSELLVVASVRSSVWTDLDASEASENNKLTE